MTFESVTITNDTAISNHLLRQMVENDKANELVRKNSQGYMLSCIKSVKSYKNEVGVSNSFYGFYNYQNDMDSPVEIEEEGWYRLFAVTTADQFSDFYRESIVIQFVEKTYDKMVGRPLGARKTPAAASTRLPLLTVPSPNVFWSDIYLVAGSYTFGIHQTTGDWVGDKYYPNFFSIQKIGG